MSIAEIPVSLLRNDELSQADERELEQFQNVELLMRLLKAKLRAEARSAATPE
ncbi:MAG: hypothetical protein WD069_18215 [Planctomycetales bacterium]